MLFYLKLIRYKNLLMVLLTMVLTKYALIETLGFTYLNTNRFVFISIVILSITASGYILNDIFDIKTDLINKPKKTYIPHLISKKQAFRVYFTLTIISSILAITICTKPIHWFIFYGTPFVLFLYSYYFKKVVFIGNFIVAILVSLPIYTVFLMDFLPGKSNVLTFDTPTIYTVLLYCFFAFITTLIREIIKDIEDINGDLKIKAKTLPILFGRKRASKVAFFFSCILFLFLLVILQALKNKPFFLVYGSIFMLLPLLYFMYSLWSSESKKDFSKLSSLMKIIMLFGILSMLLFKI